MLLVVLAVIVGGALYLFLPRATVSAAVSAALSILNTDITSQRVGATDFAPALDGDLYRTGDVVRSSKDGRAVLTFFDGSSLTVDPGSVVKVTTLERLEGGGIQVVIEQTLGRTWASVEKLKTPDSKFEVKTPTSTASVRGTAFETVVTQNADGTTTVTYKADEGQLVVTASAGGQTTVTANTQVTIAQNQTAPASSTPIPPSPAIRLAAPSGVGYALVAPTGARCGSEGNLQQIPGCLVNGSVLTIREPVAGRYTLMLTSAAAVANANVTVEALRGTTREATQSFTRTFALGDLIRTFFTYGAGTPLTLGAFEPAEQITSVCGAEATGRVFSSGDLDARYDLLTKFAAGNHGQPVSLVVTEAEVASAIAKSMENAKDAPAQLRDVALHVDLAGLHISGNLVTPLGTFAASGDVAAGPVNGRLVLRVRNLTAGPVPAAILQQIESSIDQGMAEFTNDFPFSVRQVALRQGCLGIMGTTAG